jgi:hypothetical protein
MKNENLDKMFAVLFHAPSFEIKVRGREIACAIAQHAQSICALKGYVVDDRSQDAINVSEKYSVGRATLEELGSAKRKAQASAWQAKTNTESAARWAARFACVGNFLPDDIMSSAWEVACCTMTAAIWEATSVEEKFYLKEKVCGEILQIAESILKTNQPTTSPLWGE